MRLKEPPPVRKHVHSWKINMIDPPFLYRKCTECKALELGPWDDAAEYPESYRAYADIAWEKA